MSFSLSELSITGWDDTNSIVPQALRVGPPARGHRRSATGDV